MIYQIMAQVSETDIPGLPKTSLTNVSVNAALQLVFGVAGGIALLIITIAGLQYVLSQGDPQKSAKAKNTVLYALIGLVICITAFSLVTFVLGGL